MMPPSNGTKVPPNVVISIVKKTALQMAWSRVLASPAMISPIALTAAPNSTAYARACTSSPGPRDAHDRKAEERQQHERLDSPP